MGVVGLIVKADDDVALEKERRRFNYRRHEPSRAVGRALVRGMPGFLTFLGAGPTPRSTVQ